MTRDEMLTALGQLEEVEVEYYVHSADTDDHPSHAHSWCFKHADMVSRVAALLAGESMLVVRSWAETDVAARCEWHDCDVALCPDGAGLTDHGVDSALGLTEQRPLACHVYPTELVMAHAALATGDPRWRVWEWHACRLLGQPLPPIETHGRCGGVVMLRHDGWRCSSCRRVVRIGS